MMFVTDRGVSVPAVTTSQMREVDRIAIEETGPNLFQMMENAGRNLAAVVIDVLGRAWRQAHVVVLAGTGGNGGGGIAAGRHLVNRGVSVRVVVTDAAALRGVPEAQLRLYRRTGGTVGSRATETDAPDLIIDAVIGYGLRDAPRGRSAELIEQAGASGAQVVSLDIPSGVDATTGAIPGLAVMPLTTVTLGLPKTGLATAPTGRLLLADIGIPSAVFARAGVVLERPVFDERWVVPLRLAG